MTPTDPSNPNPNMDENTARFRAILSASEEEEESPKPTPPPSRSVLDLLPRTKKQSEPAPQPVPGSASGSIADKLPRAKRPAAPRPAPVAQEQPVAPPPVVTSEPADPSEKRRFGPAFWTITGILSLIVNAVLIAIVIILLGTVSKLNIKVGELMSYASLPEATVKGLYDNFVKMDEAHIRATIPVTAEIPVQFNLELNTQTEVVLSQDTPINQARVTLTTGGLNISNAPANIILPAGTRLPITLTLTVPVDKRVPVSLVVPVDIALNQTDLHEPFVGLQTVVQPLYCLLNAQATSPSGVLICEQAAP